MKQSSSIITFKLESSNTTAINKIQESPVKLPIKNNDKEKIINNFKTPNERKFSNSPSIPIKKGQNNDLGEFRLELKSKIFHFHFAKKYNYKYILKYRTFKYS